MTFPYNLITTFMDPKLFSDWSVSRVLVKIVRGKLPRSHAHGRRDLGLSFIFQQF